MAGQESLPLRRLKEFQPLNRLTDDQLVLLASRAERRTHGPGQRVLERGVREGLAFFLVAVAYTPLTVPANREVTVQVVAVATHNKNERHQNDVRKKR